MLTFSSPAPETATLLPKLVLTPGDPTGIGPEITARVLSDQALLKRARFSVFGDQAAVMAAFGRWGDVDRLQVVEEPSTLTEPGLVCLYDAHIHEVPEVAPEITALRAAVSGCLSGAYSGLVTGPISKQRLMGLGFPYPGHTGYLAHLLGATNAPVMTFVSSTLRVALVTDHVRFSDVPGHLTKERLMHTIQVAHSALRDNYRIAAPRLALCGLNPHAGEGGHLGDEEAGVLKSAVRQAQAAGIDISGPLPADSVFLQGLQGQFDLIVALYHDQGLIPIKLLGRGASVHITLGLPILRTSVDHGTAPDIAGRGIADSDGLRAAIEEAILLART